jgi:bacterial/archaeal transporter family-2 protein
MALLLVLAAVGIGAAATAQAGVNAELARSIGGPLRAGSVSFVVGTVAIVAITLLFARNAPGARPGDAPWWAWLGGLGGALFIGAGTALAPRLGAVNLFVAVIFGQLVCSALLDRFGILFAQRALTTGRIAGIALVAAGVVLVRIT